MSEEQAMEIRATHTEGRPPVRFPIPSFGLRIPASPDRPWIFYGLHIETPRDHTAWVTVTLDGDDEPCLRTMCPAGAVLDSEMPLQSPRFDRPVTFRLVGEGSTASVVIQPQDGWFVSDDRSNDRSEFLDNLTHSKDSAR